MADSNTAADIYGVPAEQPNLAITNVSFCITGSMGGSRDLSVVRMNGTGEAVIEWRLWLILGC